MKKIISLLTVFVLLFGMFPAAQANEYMNVYALDGRVEVIRISDFNAWHAVGWYSAPVMTVYANDGRTEIIPKADYAAWNSVGWYSDIPIMIYAPDGRSQYIPKNEFSQWQKAGWYSAPVMYVYALDGRTQLILTADFSKWHAVGWYSVAERVTGWWFHKNPDEIMSHFSENVYLGADGTFSMSTWREKRIGTYTIQGNKIIAKYDFYYNFAGTTTYELIPDLSDETIYEFDGRQLRENNKYLERKNGYTKI